MKQVDAREIEFIEVEFVEVREGRRALNEKAVETLMESMVRIGLRTPISVRYYADRPDWIAKGDTDDALVLMTGRHRLEAAKRLGWEKVECIVHNEGDEVDAELWEIAENLHRAELTALERDEQIARWAELAARRVSDKLSETGKAKGGRPGIAAKAAKELGVDERAVQRAVRVASLSDEAKAVARETGLADNRTALLDAAKRPTPAEQVEAIRQRAAPKAVKLADDPLNNLEAREKQVAALMAAWNRASKEAREEFLSRVDSPVMDASRRHA